MKLDEKWIREHLPEDCRDEPINRFSGLYLDGLTVISEGERGEPAKICYEAKDEEDLKWWQLDIICGFIGKTGKSKNGDGIGIIRRMAGGIISNTDNMTIMQSKTPGCRDLKDTSEI